jgi:hypothetical protein
VIFITHKLLEVMESPIGRVMRDGGTKAIRETDMRHGAHDGGKEVLFQSKPGQLGAAS